MDALVVGKLSIEDKKALGDQALALAVFTMNFRGHGDPSNALLNEVSKLSAMDVTIVNRYHVEPPQAVFYKKTSEDTDAKQTADALAEAFGKLTGAKLPVTTFPGDTSQLSHKSIVIVDPSQSSLNGDPRFKLADISRQKEMEERPDGGDSNSGLIAIGRLSKAFVSLIKRPHTIVA